MAKSKGNILLGICAGIASYKSCELTRLFVKAGFSVRVVMSESARRFVSPLVFQSLSGNAVYHEMFEPCQNSGLEHISLAEWAGCCVIAPLSANTLSKIACGICDNLLTTIVCALGDDVPVVLCPAMNDKMWKNPIIRDNADKLSRHKGYHIINPAKGQLACGSYGEGCLPAIELIYKKTASILQKKHQK